MTDRRFGLLVAAPLMAVGCLAAHSLGYRLASAGGDEGVHGYLGAAPLLLAIGVALVAVGLVGRALAVSRGEPGARPSVLAAALPPVAFALQEHLERVFHDHGGSALGTAAEPAFLVGLALQLPFALAALALARGLLRAASAVGRAIARRRSRTRAAALPCLGRSHLVLASAPASGIPLGRSPPRIA